MTLLALRWSPMTPTPGICVLVIHILVSVDRTCDLLEIDK